ncbi:MAG: protein-S-isoprenylcysteine O-methyltransferase [Pseudomonadota bacterium]
MSEAPPSGAATAKRLILPFAIAVVLAGLAMWQGRLSVGVVCFLFMALCSLTIRVLITDATPLPVVRTIGGQREAILIQFVGAGMMYLPAIMIATLLLDFAGYEPSAVMLGVGVALAAFGLWLFWRSHTDLGTYWSPTLELREGHQLVTRGVYARLRHPMYAALFVITAAQACFLGNWIAGPAGIIALGLLYLLRIDDEERMMGEAFGAEWSAYAGRTGRLLPSARK